MGLVMKHHEKDDRQVLVETVIVGAALSMEKDMRHILADLAFFTLSYIKKQYFRNEIYDFLELYNLRIRGVHETPSSESAKKCCKLHSNF